MTLNYICVLASTSLFFWFCTNICQEFASDELCCDTWCTFTYVYHCLVLPETKQNPSEVAADAKTTKKSPVVASFQSLFGKNTKAAETGSDRADSADVFIVAQQKKALDLSSCSLILFEEVGARLCSEL